MSIPNCILPGDEVEVYDGDLGDYRWCVVMDCVERDGRLKLRIEGQAFYFDSSCVRNVRVELGRARPEGRPVNWNDPAWASFFNSSWYADPLARRTIY